MLNYEAIKSWPFETLNQTITARDAMLYALGVGMGADPMDEGQLRYVYEKDLQVMPSMAAVLCTPGSWMRDPGSGIDYVRIVHGEQDIVIHQPLPLEGEVHATTRVTRVTDKGPGKGATIEQVRELRADTGELLATVRQVAFGRGEGGYSAQGGRSDDAPPALPATPERAADAEVTLSSYPQAALLYRLSGDYNPLHSDPAVAAKAGFPRPILHGLCSYGMAAHAVLRQFANYESQRLKRMAVRFSSPVYPGEAITFQMWQGDGGVHLRARVAARDVVVLNNGWFELS